ncbi:LysM peptidoglycan-binding domain-containing protein [Clostridium sp. JN-1]|uniref:LysM peptidoglycan-binding domain-containing protein n=1 Tax=Clostridium sp. JN-1 TaxID=2483110 RepID=UPI000F0B1CE1|nr:LysM peptidoglycan-binding domain-containing protein [Clostridium sp. JN-1]
MIIHVIKSGESLWQISNYYDVSINKIIEVNGLPYADRLVIGQALLIPTEDFFHNVKAGETIWSIAKSYGISPQSIIQANPAVNPDSIYPGLKLYIPAPKHIVKPGETLSEIADLYGISLQSLMTANDIKNPSMIQPGETLVIPVKRERPNIDVNGYIYFLGNEAVPIVKDEGKYLTYLSPFAYRIREDGSLQPIDDTPAINEGINQKAVPMMAITNFTSTELGQNLAHVVLSSPSVQQTLFTNIINTMKQKGYKGVNIDFEGVLPADRDLYNRFLREAVLRLHRENFFVSSALAPKTSEQQQGSLYTAHDYRFHGRILDFVILMTYEWGYRLGPPQPISPLNQIIRVLDYAVSVIPRDKIYFGFQLYARDWLIPHVSGQQAETFSMQEALTRAINHGAAIQYDPISQTPFYQYKDKDGRMHEVWFEDARSAQAKFDTVKRYNLRGISYWALGFPFPQNWALLEDNFSIKKLI